MQRTKGGTRASLSKGPDRRAARDAATARDMREQIGGPPDMPDDAWQQGFVDLEAFDLDGDGPRAAQEKKVDADFFNAFGDQFDEDDMNFLQQPR